MPGLEWISFVRCSVELGDDCPVGIYAHWWTSILVPVLFTTAPWAKAWQSWCGHCLWCRSIPSGWTEGCRVPPLGRGPYRTTVGSSRCGRLRRLVVPLLCRRSGLSCRHSEPSAGRCSSGEHCCLCSASQSHRSPPLTDPLWADGSRWARGAAGSRVTHLHLRRASWLQTASYTSTRPRRRAYNAKFALSGTALNVAQTSEKVANPVASPQSVVGIHFEVLKRGEGVDSDSPLFFQNPSKSRVSIQLYPQWHPAIYTVTSPSQVASHQILVLGFIMQDFSSAVLRNLSPLSVMPAVLLEVTPKTSPPPPTFLPPAS